MSHKTPKVKLYSTRQCQHCKRAKAYLRQNKIPYVEFDVETNRRAFKDFQKAGGRGVPLVIIGSQRLNGFNQAELGKTLKKAGFDV